MFRGNTHVLTSAGVGLRLLISDAFWSTIQPGPWNSNKLPATCRISTTSCSSKPSNTKRTPGHPNEKPARWVRRLERCLPSLSPLGKKGEKRKLWKQLKQRFLRNRRWSTSCAVPPIFYKLLDISEWIVFVQEIFPALDGSTQVSSFSVNISCFGAMCVPLF